MTETMLPPQVARLIARAAKVGAVVKDHGDGWVISSGSHIPGVSHALFVYYTPTTGKRGRTTVRLYRPAPLGRRKSLIKVTIKSAIGLMPNL